MSGDNSFSNALSGAGAEYGQMTTRTEFLRLFIAQLENQDPLEPQDGSEFVAQLAQFAQLEQSSNINARLEAIEASQATVAGTALGEMVGKLSTVNAETVLANGDDSAPPLEVRLAGAATSITVTIKDADGNPVHTIELPEGGPGDVAVNWDGRLPDGLPLPAGEYSIEVTAVDSTGTTVSARPILHGTLEAVDFVYGAPRLRFGSLTVTPSEVITIGM